MTALALGWLALLGALALGPSHPALAGLVLAMGLVTLVAETWRLRGEG